MATLQRSNHGEEDTRSKKEKKGLSSKNGETRAGRTVWPIIRANKFVDENTYTFNRSSCTRKFIAKYRTSDSREYTLPRDEKSADTTFGPRLLAAIFTTFGPSTFGPVNFWPRPLLAQTTFGPISVPKYSPKKWPLLDRSKSYHFWPRPLLARAPVDHPQCQDDMWEKSKSPKPKQFSPCSCEGVAGLRV